jgi:hypothetical protein
VWFAGVHADIGGGYAENGPADISFIWMLAQLAPLLTLDLLGIPDELDTTEDYGFGTLNESFSGLLTMAGEKRRTVGPGAYQYVHETARTRFGYRGYPINPDFDFDKLPVWPRDAFEQGFAWSKTGPFAAWPAVPGRRQSFCAKMLKWLEGS